jgi:hypothetical protein
MDNMEFQEHSEPANVGKVCLPAYFSDFDSVNHLHKSKSGYYVRVKGWNDGVRKNCNAPSKSGYYFDEYMIHYRIALSELPF